jgi:thioesterase domain-containing protein/aryl carrier-like protein
VLVTLSCGASLHLCAREQPLAGEQLLTILRARHISHLTLSPSALNTLPRQQELPDLSTLVVAGESCPAELARRWGRPRRFLNAYGPSEATVCATLYQCGTVDDGNLPIGAPIPNVHIYVLDEHLQPVPVGVVGEIYIGGVGVARGYLNRPELTAQRFLPDPFRAGERMYKSGDFGCWRADANLELAGRQDQQVNLRGYRIELGAIEAVLLQQSAVSEAAVLLREDAGEKLLVAYLTGAATLDLDAIRLELKAVLPHYMMPAALVVLPTLPRTPAGKLDRNALPAPHDSSYRSATDQTPRGELENTIADIWCGLLQLQGIGRHDNFFEIGGHSLLAVALVQRMRDRGCQVSVSSVFRHPTIAALAQSLPAELHDEPSDLVMLRSGTERPLFVIHDASGDLQSLAALTKRLRDGIPVQGLKVTDPAQIVSIERLAARHVDAIRRSQPRGPYRLVGHALGGLIAYEVATQLIGVDEPIEFLGMIDSDWPDHRVPPAMSGGAVTRACIAAAARYRPAPIPLPVHLYTCRDGAAVDRWSALLPRNLRVESLDSTRASLLLEPRVGNVANCISRALQAGGGRAHSEAKHSPLIPIQAIAPGLPPVFCVPGAGASVTSFLQLSDLLAARACGYGLQPRGLDSTLVPHSSVEAAARSYIDAIRSVQRRGPYRLIGHSFGGWIVFEMARQLLAAGECLDPVVVLDSRAPSSRRHPPYHYGRFLALIKLISAMEESSGRKLAITREQIEALDGDAQELELMRSMKAVGLTSSRATLRGLIRVFMTHLNATYVPATAFDGAALLIQARDPTPRRDGDEDFEPPRPIAAWRDYAPQMEIVSMPGNHMTLLQKPHAQLIAQRILGLWDGTAAVDRAYRHSDETQPRGGDLAAL